MLFFLDVRFVRWFLFFCFLFGALIILLPIVRGIPVWFGVWLLQYTLHHTPYRYTYSMAFHTSGMVFYEPFLALY